MVVAGGSKTFVRGFSGDDESESFNGYTIADFVLDPSQPVHVEAIEDAHGRRVNVIPGAKSLPFEASEVPGYWGAREVDLSHDACSKDDVDGDGDLCAVGLQLNEDGTGTATTSFRLVIEEPIARLAGDWVLDGDGAAGVGPSAGSTEWWAS